MTGPATVLDIVRDAPLDPPLGGPLSFQLPDGLVATAPVEAAGGRRDDARLLVAWRRDGRLVDTTFAELTRFLDPGDVLLVNTSATVPAAVPTTDGRLLHVSGELPGRLWIVELRRPCGAGSQPHAEAGAGETVPLPGGAAARLLAPFPASHEGGTRLWTALLELPDPVLSYLARFGHPIRYGCGDEQWPIDAYQTVFSAQPGSAEMPSAGRAFSGRHRPTMRSRPDWLAQSIRHASASTRRAVGRSPRAAKRASASAFSFCPSRKLAFRTRYPTNSGRLGRWMRAASWGKAGSIGTSLIARAASRTTRRQRRSCGTPSASSS